MRKPDKGLANNHQAWFVAHSTFFKTTVVVRGKK